MAKAKGGRTRSGAKAKGGRNARNAERITISFVGDIIGTAVVALEKRLGRLPQDAVAPRRAVKSAIAGLKFVAAATKTHCDSWFMAPR